MVVAGLNPNGFDRNTWVAGGKQGLFEEDNFTSPAYVVRLDYKGLPGLRVGGSFYYCADAGTNSDKPDSYASSVPVRIFTADAQFRAYSGLYPFSHFGHIRSLWINDF